MASIVSNVDTNKNNIETNNKNKNNNVEIKISLIKGHRDSVLCLAATQKYLLSGSADKTVRLWDRKTNKCLKAMLLKDEVNSVAFHSRKDHLIYATCNNSIYMFDVKNNNNNNGPIIKIPTKYNDNATDDEINDLIIDSKGKYLICVDDKY